METRPRFLQLPDHSFFLFGPRGTGKTTWLRHELPGARFFDLLRADLYRELAARPERLAAAVLNAAAVAREAQVQRKTVAGYLDLLEELLLSFRLPVFTREETPNASS